MYDQIQLPLKPKGSLSILMTHELLHLLNLRQDLEECTLRLNDKVACWVWSFFLQRGEPQKIW